MLIAVAASGYDLNAVVPETYEESRYLLIVETDRNTIITVYKQRDEDGLFFADKVLQHDCEALACGRMQKVGFEKVANGSVTRYYASGCTIMEAAFGALENKLPYIVDFEGGTGCGDHSESNCEHHQHELGEE